MNSPDLQRTVFLFLLAAVTAAFFWILMPFFGAVLWAIALAILFTPLYKRLLKKMPKRRNLAALATLAICLVIVIIPLAMVTVSLVQEASLVTQTHPHRRDQLRALPAADHRARCRAGWSTCWTASAWATSRRCCRASPRARPRAAS